MTGRDSFREEQRANNRKLLATLDLTMWQVRATLGPYRRCTQ